MQFLGLTIIFDREIQIVSGLPLLFLLTEAFLFEFLDAMLETNDAGRLKDETLRKVGRHREVDDVFYLVKVQRDDGIQLVKFALLLQLSVTMCTHCKMNHSTD
jgi:hypothetical protein